MYVDDEVVKLNKIEVKKVLKDDLTLLGLSESESLVYLALIKNPGATARELSNQLVLSRQRVYNILESLENKGLIFLSSQKPKRFYPVPPEVATSILARKQEEIFHEALRIRERFLNVLNESKYPHRGHELPSLSFEISGRHTIINVIKDLLKKTDKELLIIATRNELVRMVYQAQSEFENTVSRGVALQILGPFSAVPEDIREVVQGWGVWKEIENPPARLYIRDSQEMLLIPAEGTLQERGKYDCALWVFNGDIVRMIRLLFLNGWKDQ